MKLTASLTSLAFVWSVSAATTIQIAPGFVTKLICRGRLLASAVGNQNLIEVEPLSNMGQCAVFLKPKDLTGSTNLFLETSTGTHSIEVEIKKSSKSREIDLYSIKARAR